MQVRRPSTEVAKGLPAGVDARRALRVAERVQVRTATVPLLAVANGGSPNPVVRPGDPVPTARSRW